MATFKTKPRGDQASFLTDCCHCGGELKKYYGGHFDNPETSSIGRVQPK